MGELCVTYIRTGRLSDLKLIASAYNGSVLESSYEQEGFMSVAQLCTLRGALVDEERFASVVGSAGGIVGQVNVADVAEKTEPVMAVLCVDFDVDVVHQLLGASNLAGLLVEVQEAFIVPLDGVHGTSRDLFAVRRLRHAHADTVFAIFPVHLELKDVRGINFVEGLGSELHVNGPLGVVAACPAITRVLRVLRRQQHRQRLAVRNLRAERKGVPRRKSEERDKEMKGERGGIERGLERERGRFGVGEI